MIWVIIDSGNSLLSDDDNNPLREPMLAHIKGILWHSLESN